MGNKCPTCDADNPETKQFCADCGTKLPSINNDRAKVTETLQTPVRELTTGSMFASRYQVIEELGHGGMGRVYKVLDTDIKEKIALKLLRPEIGLDKKTIERFSNELKLARKVRHKNICGMFDLGKAEGTAFITMEFVPGQDLKRLIRQTGRLGAGKAVLIAKQVCDGLAEAHDLGVIHRDLKPQNIMVDEDGNARIMDFGIARSLKGKGITGAGVMIGTPEYMSPEQVEGKEAEQPSDIYSLGIVLYEMLTGRVPFEGDTPFSIGVKHKSESPKDPRQFNAQIPEGLSRLILKCLEKDKAKRYQTANELHEDLEKVEQNLPTTERVVAKRRPFTSREITVKFSLKKLVIPLILVAMLAATAAMLLRFLPSKKITAAPKIGNSIAVISFKNQTGETAYDYLQEAIPNLLITNLENTGLFYVATWERMQDILRQMGVKQTRTIDSDLGFELCRREGIKAIAIGSFTKAGDVFRTDVKILDADSKRLLKSANIKGTGINSILDSQIDELSREMSLGLGIDKAKIEAAPLKVKDVTTNSLQAYDHFLKGKQAYALINWPEAKKKFEAALEIDPSFAMAYVYLAWAYHNTGDVKVRNETIEKAMAVSNKTSPRDRLYLEAGYALFIQQDPDKHYALFKELVEKYPDEKWAFHYLGDFVMQYQEDFGSGLSLYEKWHQLDPRDAMAINHVIGASYLTGNFKKAAEYIREHDAVAPPDPYNLMLQGMMYGMMGQFDKGASRFQEALALQPDFYLAFSGLVLNYAVRERFEESLKWADEYVSHASSIGLKAEAYGLKGFYRYWLGNFSEALEDFKLADKFAEEAENWGYKATALEGKGVVYQATGKLDLSRTEFESELKILGGGWGATLIPYFKAYVSWRLGILALEQGEIGKANEMLSEMKALLPEIKGKSKSRITVLVDLFQGEILLDQGDMDGALAASQRACGPESPCLSVGYYDWRFNTFVSYSLDLTARVLDKKGDTAKAISEYERLLKIPFTYKSVFFIHPLFHYRLSLLYSKAGERVKAKAQLERFLDLWKDADPGLPEVEDARRRLAGLTGI